MQTEVEAHADQQLALTMLLPSCDNMPVGIRVATRPVFKGKMMCPVSNQYGMRFVPYFIYKGQHIFE